MTANINTLPRAEIEFQSEVQFADITIGGERTGGSLSLDLDSTTPLVGKDTFSAQTGFCGSLVAEIKIGHNNGVLLGVVDTRSNDVMYHGMPVVWQDEKELATSTSPVVLVQLDKRVDDDGVVTYSSIEHPSQAVVRKGIGANLHVGREDNELIDRGFKFDDFVSADHLSISYDEQSHFLNIRDNKSLNGTTLTTDSEALKPQNRDRIASLVGEVANNEALGGKEVFIDGIKFRIEGRLAGTREKYVLSSTDQKGKSRRFLVYRSNSEGAFRTSPGIDAGNRYLKGAEDDKGHYTQETQLHPALEEALNRIKGSLDKKLVRADDLHMDRKKEAIVRKDFREAVQAAQFPDNELGMLLASLDAGDLSEQGVRSLSRISPETHNEDPLNWYVDEINKGLERRPDLLPDFSKPISTREEIHPILGPVERTVFLSQAGETQLEWQFCTDSDGRVWIDRIRKPNAKASSYGTDDTFVHSGILTSKPIDYEEQTTGIDPSLIDAADTTKGYLSNMPFEYRDITRFLDKFIPVQQFREAIGVTRP